MELLMVIIVLSIVLLISVPIAGIIANTAKKSAAETSAKKYLQSLDNYITSQISIESEYIIPNVKYGVLTPTQVQDYLVSPLNDIIEAKGEYPNGYDDYVILDDNYKVKEAVLTIMGFKITIKNGKFNSTDNIE